MDAASFWWGSNRLQAQRPDGAGDEGGHGEQPEGRQRAADQGEEELDRDLAGRFFGSPAPVRPDLAGEALETGPHRGAVALRRHQGGDQVSGGLAGAGAL